MSSTLAFPLRLSLFLFYSTLAYPILPLSDPSPLQFPLSRSWPSPIWLFKALDFLALQTFPLWPFPLWPSPYSCLPHSGSSPLPRIRFVFVPFWERVLHFRKKQFIFLDNFFSNMRNSFRNISSFSFFHNYHARRNFKLILQLKASQIRSLFV